MTPREFLTQLRRVLMRRRTQYQLTFRTPPGQLVLRDLARFCRVNESTYTADARQSALLEGRREVFLRIMHHIKLPPDQLWDLYDGRRIPEDMDV